MLDVRNKYRAAFGDRNVVRAIKVMASLGAGIMRLEAIKLRLSAKKIP